MKVSKYLGNAIFIASIFSVSLSFAEDEVVADASTGGSTVGSKFSELSSAIQDKSKAFLSQATDYVKKEKEEFEAKSPGLNDEKEAIVNKLQSLHEMYLSASVIDPGFTKIREGGKQYNDHQADCVTRQNTAAKWCLETLSPNVTDVVTSLNMMLSAVGGASVNDSCSAFARAMDLAKAGMTAYSAACGTTKAGCGYACVKARKGVEKVQEGLKEVASCAPSNTVCSGMIESYKSLKKDIADLIAKELDKADQKSVAGKAELCTGKYAQLAASAMLGIGSIVNSMNQAKQCDAATAASSVATQTLEEKCAIAANANLPQCICLKNPMLEGCGSVSVKGTTSAEGFGAVNTASGDKGVNTTNGLKNSDLSMGNSGLDGSGGKTTASAGGAPAPVGGGSAGLGGGGGGSGSGRDPADEASGQKGLNTNILGGVGGGGGGGRGWGAGGDSGDGKGYRSYLPGGEKDPNKMAGQQSWAKEVTGQGGKSNWEKVKDRYRDNKSTLLGN